MPDTHAARRDKVRSRLAADDTNVDALLVVDLVNIRYLTGFTGSNAVLLLHSTGEGRTVFCTDGRYETQAAHEVPDLDRVIERRSVLAMAKRATDDHICRLGFESQHVTVDGFDRISEAAESVAMVRAPGIVERLREVKDASEIESLRRACGIADHALAGLIEDGGLRAGRTELDVARELEARMLAGGAQAPSFDSIVAAGANSAVPHHRPTGAVLGRGDLVKMDFGATVDGYHSDMTRTIVLGAPAAWQRELYELVAAAHGAGTAAVAPGAEAKAVDAAARRVIVDAGHGERFSHGLGHGVGLAVHEAPSLGENATGTLSAGMAVTVEPGVYLAGRGGVRIEDTLVVREGPAEVLTLTTKELVAV